MLVCRVLAWLPVLRWLGAPWHALAGFSVQDASSALMCIAQTPLSLYHQSKAQFHWLLCMHRLCASLLLCTRRASSSSSWQLSGRSGSLTRCATCTTRSPSHRQSSSATPRERWGGAGSGETGTASPGNGRSLWVWNRKHSTARRWTVHRTEAWRCAYFQFPCCPLSLPITVQALQLQRTSLEEMPLDLLSLTASSLSIL